MPSWNIHTAHVERLLSECDGHDLGIADANAFLFGNYAPDIYLGFMVPDITYRIDYCLTHCAKPSPLPIPDSHRFWNDYIARRRPVSETRLSLTLGAWAHLATDRIYNARFNEFREARGLPVGDELRTRKQADFDRFGRSLDISSTVEITPELLEAARAFRPYSILPDDATRAAAVARAIVLGNVPADTAGSYELLSDAWLTEVFEACNERLLIWLKTWRTLESQDLPAFASDIQNAAELAPLTSAK